MTVSTADNVGNRTSLTFTLSLVPQVRAPVLGADLGDESQRRAHAAAEPVRDLHLRCGGQSGDKNRFQRTEDHTYDTLNRLLSKVPQGGTGISFTYTATGQRFSMTDPSGTTQLPLVRQPRPPAHQSHARRHAELYL